MDPQPEDWQPQPRLEVGKIVMLASKVAFAGVKKLCVKIYRRLKRR